MNPSVKIFAGTGSTALAEKIAQRFGAPIGKINIQKYVDNFDLIKWKKKDIDKKEKAK